MIFDKSVNISYTGRWEPKDLDDAQKLIGELPITLSAYCYHPSDAQQNRVDIEHHHSPDRSDVNVMLRLRMGFLAVSGLECLDSSKYEVSFTTNAIPQKGKDPQTGTAALRIKEKKSKLALMVFV